MTPKKFKQSYWPGIATACQVTGLNPLFVAAQAALETGWGKSAIGNNLFGITASTAWKGLTQTVTTTEYFPDEKQGSHFVKVHSITRLPDGRYKYIVDRKFRDYRTVAECIEDHSRILRSERYATAWPFRQDVYEYALRIARLGYCTAPAEEYAASIRSIANTIERL